MENSADKVEQKTEKVEAPAEQRAEKVEEKHDVDYADPEEESKAAVSGLKDVKVTTGTEDEVCIFKERAKLFRFRDNQWKERGIGNAKLMRNDTTKRVRFVMRQEKTLKPCGNFLVTEPPSCVLAPMGGNGKQFMWPCVDFSDSESPPEGILEKLAVRFNTVEQANSFKEKFEAAQQFNMDAKADKELTWADAVEDVDEVAEDDIDTNKPADADGGDD